MFGKKILSIVGLIFLGSQFVYANDCSATYDGETCTANECTASDNDKLLLVSSTAEGDENNYVMKITYDEKSSIASCAKETGIDDADVCVSDKNVISTDLRTGFCTDDACVKYMKCATTGICTDAIIGTTRDSGSVVTPKCNPSDADTVSSCGKGYHVMSSDSTSGTEVLTLIDDGNVGTVLFNCNGVDTCTLETDIPVGYLINGNKNSKGTYKYIECNGENCKAITVAAATGTTDCSQNKAGDIVLISEVANICISTTVNIALTENEEGASAIKYFVKHDSTASSSNVFQDNDVDLDQLHFMVEISASGTDVTFPTKEGESGIKYRYADDKQRIYERTDADRLTAICPTTKTMVDYTKDYKAGDAIDYYVQGNTSATGPIAPAAPATEP